MGPLDKCPTCGSWWEWISVNERLPEDGQSVLVTFEFTHHTGGKGVFWCLITIAGMAFPSRRI